MGGKFDKLADEGEFLNSLTDLTNYLGEVHTTSLRGLAGTGLGLAVKGSNVAGRAARGVEKFAKKNVAKFNKELQELTPQQVKAVLGTLKNSSNKVIQKMGENLEQHVTPKGTLKGRTLIQFTQFAPVREAIREGMSDLNPISSAQASDFEDKILQGIKEKEETPAMMQGVPYNEHNEEGTPYEKKDTTEVNDNLEGYVVSKDDRPEFSLGGIQGNLTGADKEEGHGYKEVEYIDSKGTITPYKGKMNLGLDYAPSNDLDKDIEGTQYNPMFDGNVVLSGIDQYSPGHGNSVIVQSPKTVTINGKEYDAYAAYGHNKDSQTKVGETVSTETPIATMGNTVSVDGKIKSKQGMGNHVDIRTFLVPKGEDWNRPDKLYINPKELEGLMQPNKYESLMNDFRSTSQDTQVAPVGQDVEQMQSLLEQLKSGRNPASEPTLEQPIAQPIDMTPEDLERDTAQEEIKSGLLDVEEGMSPEDRGQATQELQSELLRLHKMLATGGDDGIVAGMIDNIIPLVEKSVLNPEESQAMIYRLSQANPEDISNMIDELQAS
jgi:murein DD-endopeptidase MepM/ murein hydrolase activator NlpD